MRGFKITTVESQFLEPHENSKQKSFPSPQSNTVIFRTNFPFPSESFEKSGLHRIFGMIIVSLDIACFRLSVRGDDRKAARD